MKKKKLKMMTWISIAMLMCLAGCGSKESEEISTENSEVPATEESVMAVKEEHTQEDFSKFGQIYYEEGYLYYYEGKYDPEIKRSSYTIKRNKINESAEQLARLENIKILRSCVPDGEGNIYLLYGTCEDVPVEEGIKSENSTESTGETTASDEPTAGKAAEKTTGTGKEEIYYYLEKRTATGERLYAEKADAFMPFLESAIISTTVTEEGEVYALTMEGYILIWDSQGKEAESILTGWDMEKVSGNGKQCGIAFTEGSSVKAYYCEGRTLYLCSVNRQSKKIMEPEKVEIPASGEEIVSVSRDGTDGFFLVDQKQLWKYSRESEELELICEWNDKNINQQAEFIELVARKDATSYYLVLYDFFQNVSSIVTVEKMNVTDLPEGKEIVIGCLYRYNGTFDELVKEYQKEQKEYYITWKAYGWSELKQAILWGEGPDLLWLNDMMIGELTDKGILEDLSGWMDQSENLKREDIIPSARKAAEYDGGWWYLFPCFTVETMIIKKGEVQDNEMTTEQFLNLDLPEGSWLCETNANTLTTYNLVRRTLLADIEHYLNWEKRECYFDSEEFQNLLRSIAKVKVPISEEYGNLGLEEICLAQGLSEEKYLAHFQGLSTVMDFRYLKEAVGEIADITGYPSSEGKMKYLFNSSVVVGMNSASKQKEGAWDFLEYMMLNTIKKQGDADVNCNIFSTVENILDRQLSWKNPGDGIVRNNYNPYNDTYYQGDIELTEEEITELRQIIDNASWASMTAYDRFLSIIWEEAEYFFKGDKTVEDVTKVIQSRIELMMNEN